MPTKNIKPNNRGFALMMALIVIGAVISIGLTILDLSIKQISLSTDSKDSEIVFHAANAGMECAEYWAVKEALRFEEGETDIDISCFGVDVNNVNLTGTENDGDNYLYAYDFQFDWGGSAGARCSKAQMVFMNASTTDFTVANSVIRNYIAGYSSISSDKTCLAGGRCTVISVQGYNTTCANIGTPGTLQREIQLES